MTYLASLIEAIDDKVEGYYPIKTKEDLDIVVCDNKRANKIIIRRDFAAKYFTPSGLDSYVNNAKKLNRNITIEIDEKSDVMTDTRFLGKLARAVCTEDYLNLLAAYPKEFKDCIDYLLRDEKQKQRELLNASGDVSRLQSIIDTLRQEKKELEYALNIEQNNKFYVQSKLSALINRINYQYNANVDEKKLFTVDMNSYDKIIYIKEITRVQYVDSLVYYLKEILKILYSMPTRLLVIEGYYASGKEQLYKNLTPHYKLKDDDVLAGDILMMGMQPKLMTDILKNPSNISLLIVLDRCGYIAPHIKGENVEYLYTVSDVEDIPKEVPRSRIISYQEDTLYIPLVENFQELDKGERMSKYSSMEIIKQIVSLIEGR